MAGLLRRPRAGAARREAAAQAITARAVNRAIKLPGTLLPGDTGVRPGAGAAPTAPAAKHSAAVDPKSAQSLLDYLLGQ